MPFTHSGTSSPVYFVCILSGWAQHADPLTVEFKYLAFRYGGATVHQFGRWPPLLWPLFRRSPSAPAAEPELAIGWHCLLMYVSIAQHDELSLTQNLI